jgi:RNA polymerase sigma factor (sigma-70 family)
MEETLEKIFLNEIAKYPRLNRTEEEIEFAKIYLHREILKVAKTSDNPELVAYLRVIKIGDEIINKVDKRYFKNKWASSAKLSIEELDRVIKCGHSEWAKLTKNSIIRLGRIQKQGVLARKTIAIHHLYLVVKTANKYQNQEIEILDMIQDGMIGLSRAIDLFDRNKKVEFVKFAQYHIEKEIIESINKYSKIIGRRSSVMKSHFNSETEQNLLKLVPTPSEQKEELILMKDLAQTIDKLDLRGKIVIDLRYLQDHQNSFKEIATSMKINRKTVARIKNNALKKIKSLLNLVN